MYSVNNGYRILLSNMNIVASGQLPTFWKGIWSLQVQNKVRSFIWRACSNCLPKKLALKSKQVDASEVYPICNDSVKRYGVN